ncbi:MAG: sulfite exporter TauE/SafE family protein [Candidatus Methylomirabilales bacterium]
MIFTLELVIVAAITGLVSGLIGVGGGFLFVPLLTLIGVPMRSAAGLSLLYVACISVSGAVAHYRQGTADPVVAGAAVPGALVTVSVGSYCSSLLPNNLLELLFGVLVLGAAVALRWQSKQQWPFPGASVLRSGLAHPFGVVLRRGKVHGAEYVYPVSLLYGIGVGGVTGFFSGLLGIGGGWLLTTLFILVVGLPVPIAVGTSLLSIVFPSAVGAVTHYGLGHIDIAAAIPTVLAGILGALLGVKGTAILSASRLQTIMVWLLAVVAVYMIGRGIL